MPCYEAKISFGGKDVYPDRVVKADWRAVRLETRNCGRPLELSWEGVMGSEMGQNQGRGGGGANGEQETSLGFCKTW